MGLIPHLMNTLNNSGTDPPELTLRALKFCLQRANCDASCDVIKDLQQVLVATEGLNVTSSHQIVILVLAYYYACQLARKDYKDVLNMSEASPILANIFDSITEDKIELYLQRLLTLNGWNQETDMKESDVKSTFVEICQEVSDFLALPVDVKLESVTDFKAY